MNIDIRTLSLMIGISFIMQSIALFVVYWHSKPYKGLLAWTIGSSVMALGFIFLLARQIADFERHSIVIANCLQVGGMGLIYVGTIRSTGKKEKGKLIALLMAIYSIVIAYFTYIDNQLNLRTILFSLSLAFISSMIGKTLLYQKLPSIKQSSLFVSTIFFALSLFFIVRTIVLFSSPLTDFFNQSSFQTYTFLATFCFGILWTFGLIILVNQKFYNDRIEAEKHFELIFNNSPDLAQISKLPEELIINVNEAFTQLTGYEKSEVVGHSNLDIDAFVDPSNKLILVKELQEKGYCKNLEFDFKRKDGSQFSGLLSATIVDFEGTPHIVSIIRDITDLKRAQETLQRNETHLNDAQKLSQIGSFYYNAKEDQAYWTPQLYRLYGLEVSDEPQSRSFAGSFTHPDDKQVGNSMIEKAIKTNSEAEAEYRIIRKDGAIRIHHGIIRVKTDSEGNPTEINGTVQDITELKHAIADLKEKEVQYRNLANAGLALIWTAATDKLCTYFNDPWLKFTGRAIDQELGIGWLEGVHPKDVDHCLQIYSEAFDKREPFTMEYRLKHHSGEYRWIQDMGTPNYNGEGIFIGYIGHCFDITDRKKLEFDLIAAKDKAEESDRLKSSFLANLSHEIRTPMNSIMGFASLLPDEENKELIDKYASTIVNSSEQLTHIIDDIVLYSKLQTKLLSFFPSSFEANKLLHDVHQTFNLPNYQKGVELFIDQKSFVPINLVSDYEKIRQVLTNLISNAFKYTTKGTITLGYEQRDESLLLFVKDTGIGIPHNELERIFERFYRGSNVNKVVISGTGLGLSIVKELVEIVQGKIWVESEVGKGSCFYIALPNKTEISA